MTRNEKGDEDWQLSKDSADAATAPFLVRPSYIVGTEGNGCESSERKQKAESKP